MPVLGSKEVNLTEEYLNQTEAFAQRWNQRRESRRVNVESIKNANKEKSILSLDDAERVSKRLKRLADNPLAMMVANESYVADPLGEDFRKIAEERLLGKDDIVDITYLIIGLYRARTVCRLVVDGGRSYGTGFLVSPKLLMTNNHVLPDEVTAQSTDAQFNYENTIKQTLRQHVSFKLDPDAFFFTSKKLDFTLVAVSDLRDELKQFGWNKLIASEGKAVLGENVSIIQHPGSDPKKVAIRDNELIDILPDFLHYRTDTNPGASGAPVFNDQWEVVALHHLGVPRKDQQGRALTKAGQVWDRYADDDDIDWVANEGTRVSSIVKFLLTEFPAGTNKYVDQMLEEDFVMPEPQLDEPKQTGQVEPIIINDELASSGAGLSISIPININVNLNGTKISRAASSVASSRNALVTSGDSLVTLVPKEVISYEKLKIDQDFDAREGYDPTFIDGYNIPLPSLSPEQLSKVAHLSEEFQTGSKRSYELKYHHYSVVMNAERRIAYFCAGNIDGEHWYKIVRKQASGGGSETWYFDPRIERDQQAGDALYKGNDLDRGHLIRREYMTWGDKDEALMANNDTFHWTNCSPQHKDLNQSKEQWLGLENYVLLNAKENQMRVSVFSGPVLQSKDPVYRGIKIPKSFWKVVVMAKENGKLSATGYLLHQDMLVRRVLEEEEFVYGGFRTFQVPISYIEAQTKLNFGKLRNHDPMKDRKFEEFFTESFDIPGKEFTSLNQIIL